MYLKTLLIAMLVLVGMAFTVRAQDQIFLTTRAELNIRSLPAVESPSLQKAPQGTTLLAIGRNANNTWTQVEYKGVIGWVSNVYVAFSGDSSRLPVTDATDASVNPRPQEQVSAPDGTIVQTGSLVVFARFASVNVRVLPDEAAEVLTQLAPNQRAVVTLLDPTRLWGRVSVDGHEGWVALYVVNVLGDIRTVEVLGEPASGSYPPLPEGGPSLADREVLDRLQAYLGINLGRASTLITVLSNGAASGIMACNTQDVPLFRPYRPAITDYERVPEIQAIVQDMNTAIELFNDARVPWVASCYGGNMQRYRGEFGTWLSFAQSGSALINDVQARLAVLNAK